jgi:uncharacterized protein DUF559/putative AbiEi antitoxin of type IV toxin-antitoxin system
MGGERYARSADAAIAAVAARQHGVVSRAQLSALGLKPDAIDHRLACGRLHRIHRGVFAVGHRVCSREATWMAAVLACAPVAVLCDHSAGATWDIRASTRSVVDVAVARRRRPRRGIAVHHRPMAADEITTRRGIPVTTPARTLLDLAAVLSKDGLERAVDRAEILLLTSPTSLAALVARHPGRPGVPKLRAILAASRIGATLTRSELEDRFLAFLDAHGLPRPKTNALITTAPGRALEVDAAWPAHRLIVELDGFAVHGTRRAFERDRARDAALQAQGWRVMRITARRLEDEPAAIAREIRALLRSP